MIQGKTKQFVIRRLERLMQAEVNRRMGYDWIWASRSRLRRCCWSHGESDLMRNRNCCGFLWRPEKPNGGDRVLIWLEAASVWWTSVGGNRLAWKQYTLLSVYTYSLTGRTVSGFEIFFNMIHSQPSSQTLRSSSTVPIHVITDRPNSTWRSQLINDAAIGDYHVIPT